MFKIINTIPPTNLKILNLFKVVDWKLDKYINDRMADLVPRAALHRQVLHLSAHSPREHDSSHGHLCNH